MIIRSISGVRGLTESHLTPESSIAYARALNTFLPKGVIISGRDSRPSGDMILAEMTIELVRLGRTIVQCDIVPTPTVQFMVHNTEAVGGFVVTASHNPIEWNGLKFIRGDSTFFHPDECKKLFNIVDENIKLPSSEEPGIVWKEQNSIQKHVISCVSLKCISLNKIRNKKFKIVIDAVNGAGAIALPTMLESLGCEVIELNCEPNGIFNRGTEPLPENLIDLANAVIKNKADAGFAVSAPTGKYMNDLMQTYGRQVNIMCDSVVMPQKSMETQDVQYGSEPKRSMVQTHTFDGQISASFYADKYLRERQFMEAWMKMCVGEHTHKANYYDDYVGKLQIFQLGSDNERNSRDRPTYAVEAMEVYPQEIGSVEYGYGKKNEIVKINIEFGYKYWRNMGSETKSLSFGDHLQTPADVKAAGGLLGMLPPVLQRVGKSVLGQARTVLNPIGRLSKGRIFTPFF